jgi:hypothetical protein
LVKKVALNGCICDKYALQSRAVTRPVIAFNHNRYGRKTIYENDKEEGGYWCGDYHRTSGYLVGYETGTG